MSPDLPRWFGTLLLLLGLALALPAQAVPVERTRPGTIYRQEIPVAATGDTMIVQVFEPTVLLRGRTYPLVLQGHGYGGSRMLTPSAFAQRLIDNGYYVISIDQRGFGESSGTVRVMSPDYEGQNLVAVLDWAENLPGLRRRANGEMLVGSYGGSYGGMYQLLLAGTDPRQRLRVIAPDITPNNLVYALNPGNVVKSGWGLALSAGAEGLGVGAFLSLLGGTLPTTVPTLPAVRLRQDNAVYETLSLAAGTNEFPEAGRNFFDYHSVSYFCRGLPALPQNFMLATPDPRLVPPRPFPPLDALLTQGFRDTLFNFNDGLENYDCLKAAGGDVRLLTHQSGHILPLSIATVPGNLEEALDPFYAALTLPGFQDAGGTRSCGSLNLDEVTYAWFETKLKGRTGAINQALGTTRHDVCLSLAEGDAIGVGSVRRGGAPFLVNSTTPQFNSLLGIAGAVLGNGAREALLATQTLYTAPAAGAILAGVPTMTLNLGALLPPGDCVLPVLGDTCSPALFIGFGHRKAGQQRWDLIDDQLTPIRGFGRHTGAMTGIAERLAPGDQLGLLIYAFHAQYPLTGSRALTVPAVTLGGRVNVPLLPRREVIDPAV